MMSDLIAASLVTTIVVAGGGPVAYSLGRLTSERMEIEGLGKDANSVDISFESLLAFVLGTEEGDPLRMTAADGYSQGFGCLILYLDEAWFELQGITIIALAIDSIPAPDWQDGPKLLMLPTDGLYINSDCEATSHDDQGYSVYPSAGARWGKNVVTMQAVPCP
ncbi:MAG: hypothetical protein JSU93_02655 [Methanobacteriota archaeon]|nr:MAG: hypothetical protein JSU93_02655 [Euryarchaeota archaeon]